MIKKAPHFCGAFSNLLPMKLAPPFLMAEGALSFTPGPGSRYSLYTKVVGFVQKILIFFNFFRFRQESGFHPFDINYCLSGNGEFLSE